MENDNDRRLADILVRLPDSCNDLVRFLEPFIYKIVVAKIKSNEVLEMARDDIIQEVTIQIWKWSTRIVPGPTEQFKFGYVVKIIKFQTINSMKKVITNYQNTNTVEKDLGLVRDRGRPLDLEKVEALIESLPFQHKRILKARIKFDSDTEAGQYMRMSRGTFARHCKNAIEFLESRLEDAHFTI